MTDPSPSVTRFGMRPSIAPAPSTTYTFTRVFPPNTLQPEFFASTTLPLVQDLLNGENGLAFAYGVTNSGKTWTIQGGSNKGEGGLLPRTLDVLFNSIEGLHGDDRVSTASVLTAVLVLIIENSGAQQNAQALNETRAIPLRPKEQWPLNQTSNPSLTPTALTRMKPACCFTLALTSNLIFHTVLKIDRNYEYSVFVSYAEVYNEKIFDLLATSSLSPEDPSGGVSRSNSTQSLSRSAQHPPGSSQARPLPRYLSAFLPKSITSHLGFSSSVSNSSLNTGAAWGAGDVPGTLSRKALALKSDPLTGGKYVAGLREIRVRSAEEGKAVSLSLCVKCRSLR